MSKPLGSVALQLSGDAALADHLVAARSSGPAAIDFSARPLSLAFGRDGFHALLPEDWPARVPALDIAAVLWLAFWGITMRPQVS